jgi:hypothetical protein
MARLSRIREHYIEQFHDFVATQRASCTRGSPEVKIMLGETSGLFRCLYCCDFVKNDEKSLAVEFVPNHVLQFSPIEGSFGAMRLSIERLTWDDAVLEHNLKGLECDTIADWFEQWFDPDDRRHDRNAEFSNTIHSLIVKDNSISIDFGSASEGAFWDLLQILKKAGATAVRITTSR